MSSESDLRNPQGFLRTGYYYLTGNTNNLTTTQPSQGALRVAPWVVPNPVTVTRIGAEVTTIGEAGSKVRLGIYNDDGGGLPGSLALDAGQIAGDSATVQELTVSVTLKPGVYWLGAVAQSCPTTAPTLRAANTGSCPPWGTASSSIPIAGAIWYGYLQSSVTGALPDPMVASGPATAVVPRLFVKV